VVCTDGKYKAGVKAIPQAMIILTKGLLPYSVAIPQEPSLVIDGYSFLEKNIDKIKQVS